MPNHDVPQMADHQPSRVSLTDQLRQKTVLSVYTPAEWERIPTAERPPHAVTSDGRYVVTLTDA